MAGAGMPLRVRRVPPVRLGPRKSLGQNFLRDDNIARKIVAAIDPQEEDCVLEIGPGEGALTRHLAGRCRTLTVVDVDERVVASMKSMFSDGSVEVVHGDFLATDLQAFAATHPGRFRVVGNIPYYITSAIVRRLMESKVPPNLMVLTVQKEVADRICAPPGNSNMTSVLIAPGLIVTTLPFKILRALNFMLQPPSGI